MGVWLKNGSVIPSKTGQCARGLVQSAMQTLCRKNRYVLSFLPTVFILCLTPASAWSFQTLDLQDNSLSGSVQSSLSFPSPVSTENADACSPLLQAIRYGSKTP